MARQLWRWLFPEDHNQDPARGRREAPPPPRWHPRCAVRRVPPRALPAPPAGAAAVLATRTFELRPSQIGGILDVRRRRGARLSLRPGYGVLPTATGARAEQAWATARYLGRGNPYRLSAIHSGARRARNKTEYRTWTSAAVMTWLLLRTVLAPQCDPLDFQIRDFSPRPSREMLADLVTMARKPHRAVRMYGQYVYREEDASLTLSFTYRPEGRLLTAHAALIVVEKGRLYHFNPEGPDLDVTADTWRRLCARTRGRVRYGGDAYALGHPACAARHGLAPQGSEPFCAVWCCALALVLGLNPRRPLTHVMQYFKLKAPTRRYLEAKVFHAAMFLTEIQERYAPPHEFSPDDTIGALGPAFRSMAVAMAGARAHHPPLACGARAKKG